MTTTTDLIGCFFFENLSGPIIGEYLNYNGYTRHIERITGGNPTFPNDSFIGLYNTEWHDGTILTKAILKIIKIADGYKLEWDNLTDPTCNYQGIGMLKKSNCVDMLIGGYWKV